MHRLLSNYVACTFREPAISFLWRFQNVKRLVDNVKIVGNPWIHSSTLVTRFQDPFWIKSRLILSLIRSRKSPYSRNVKDLKINSSTLKLDSRNRLRLRFSQFLYKNQLEEAKWIALAISVDRSCSTTLSIYRKKINDWEFTFVNYTLPALL